jgi:hypothetical protein
MAKNSGSKFDADVDALFKVPLPEFIGARKTLAAQLKKEGRTNDAELVQTLAKPPISAWAVNQLYWNYRAAFDRLIATGQRFRKAQTSRQSAKVVDMREALEARREALSELSDLATEVLRSAGHNPSLDTIRRITTTLEGMSAYASLADGPTPGRLTQDVDPPGFESLASFIPGVGATRTEVSTSKKSASTDAKSARASEARLEDERRTKIATAKFFLQDAKKSLADARARVEDLESSQKKADADVKGIEKQKREAEDRLKKINAELEDATACARSVKVEVTAAAKAVDQAKRAVDKATKELESLFRQS